jgi:hypothetical protein
MNEAPMLEVATSRELDVDAGQTWELLADWGNTQWLPGPPHTEVIGQGDGMTRRLHVPGADPIDEILLSLDSNDKELHYSIPRCQLFPLDGYEGWISVEPRPGGGCRVDWHCRFDPGELPPADAKTVATGNLERLLDNLAAYLVKNRQ